MIADKNLILFKLHNACKSPWKSSDVELPEYGTLVLGAYYTGEETNLNNNKGYKLYLCVLSKTGLISKIKDNNSKNETPHWHILTNDCSNVNYGIVNNLNYNMPGVEMKVKETPELETIIEKNLEYSENLLNKTEMPDKKEYVQSSIAMSMYNAQYTTTPAPEFWMYVPDIF